ncbi:MAG TPA: GNAT family N-acetyltransferase [Candidatus Desulfaltia sp.]|nr:GNAT family N-acetyltransferase [Candidatus Desulfaltia sp.]
MLSQAFDEDPVISWVIRDDDKRPNALRRLFTYILRESIPHGEVTASEELDACAVWLPPGVWTEPPGPLESLRMLPETLRWTGLGRLQRYRDMAAAEFAKRPREPHFYLAILGVKPSRRGQGLGSALLSHTLSRLDEAGVPAYLENSNEANTPLYERHGFKVVDTIRLMGGGPTMWCMWREPASGAQGN